MYSAENPWIKKREIAFSMWKPDYNRGYINNMNMDMSVDWYGFSRRQMREYARMLKSFGFTGMQFTDGCSNWKWFGGHETVHEKIADMANALHEEGLEVTLWVWAAQFTAHGWCDEEVRYTAKEGGLAYNDKEVFATFNKYYDIYAELAPYCDRLLLHYFDPGSLTHYEDIFSFSRLIEAKFKAVNPSVQIGIDTWGCPADFPQWLVQAGLGHYMLMELPFLPSWNEPGKRAKFREGVKKAGAHLGVWSWYTADIEIDQGARMIVNPRVIKNVYNRTREQGDSVLVPEYWSEMDSYHVLNLFSLYCAGQLLINPEQDPDTLLHTIAHKIYGAQYGDTVFRALRVLEDARCGDTWESYWPSLWERGGGDNHSDIALRAAASLAEMKQVAADKHITTDQPLPVSPYTIANLMLPHLDQIQRYAAFCVEFDKLEKMLADGADKDTLYRKLDEIWQPVPDFNVIIGVFGQTEARIQSIKAHDFCHRAGIPLPRKPLFVHTMKKRFYEYLAALSRCENGAKVFPHNYYEVVNPFGIGEQDEILESLRQDGLIDIREDGSVVLLDAENYGYQFSYDI